MWHSVNTQWQTTTYISNLKPHLILTSLMRLKYARIHGHTQTDSYFIPLETQPLNNEMAILSVIGQEILRVCVCVLWEPNVHMRLLSDEENPAQSEHFTVLHICTKLFDCRASSTGNECSVHPAYVCLMEGSNSVHCGISTINCVWNLSDALFTQTSPHTHPPTHISSYD